MALVTIKLTSTELRDALTQCMPVSRNWIRSTSRSLGDACANSGVVKSHKVHITTDDDEQEHILRAHPHGATFVINTDTHPHRAGLILRGDQDAYDAILQLLLFGDIVYG